MSRPLAIVVLLLGLLPLGMMLSPQAVATPLQVLAGETMGTTWSVTLQADAEALPGLRDGIEQRLDTVVAQMSTWEAGSDLSRYNSAAPGTAHALPKELRKVVDAALQVSRASDGAFDPTIGPLVELWGFGPGGASDGNGVPGAETLTQMRGRIGWGRLVFDSEGRLIQPGRLELDLSAIAKGFAVDEVARYLGANGVPAFLVEIGGELRGQGHKPDGSAWRIALEQPAPDDTTLDDTTLVVTLEDLAIATSGDYRRMFEREGRRYSHTIDPRTGEPVQHALASVTVLHDESMMADAWATALTVMGPDAGWDFAMRHDLAALLVWHDGNGFASRMTPAFERRLLPQ